MNDSFLKLYRKSLKSAVFDSEPLWYLWSYLLMSANWEQRQLPDGTILKPGQMVRGIRRIATDLRWSKGKAERQVRTLERLKSIQITRRPGTLAQVITICQWGTYQGFEASGRDTSGDTSGDTRRDTNGDKKKKERTTKKERNTHGHSAAFLEWWEAYPRKLGKGAAAKAYDAAVDRIRLFDSVSPEEARQRLLEAVQRFAGSDKGKGDYCWHPATWLNQGHYDDDPNAWKDSRDGRQPKPPVGQTGRVRQRSYADLPTAGTSDAPPPGET